MNFNNHQKIELYWQKQWENHNSFSCDLFSPKPKFYILDMFPYTSGKGLHVGHVEGYTASDILARYKKMKGYNVLVPMGFDSFGLPAEQYALETGNSPREFTYKNIENFKKQIKRLGKIIDWEKSFATCDEDYYAITQWIFIQLYKKGLAELKDIEVNFCPELGTVLANDEIITENGLMFSERGHHPVEKKPMKQWVLKITNYADKLLEGLSDLDWSNAIKDIQTNWIGKKQGAYLDFTVPAINKTIKIFTTRLDTIYGVSYLVLAPEHKLALACTTKENFSAVSEYIKNAQHKNQIERTINQEKTGVFTGSYAVNPLTGEQVPIWIADYVLNDFATGAVMAVPAHDERDYQFAVKFNLPIKKIIDCEDNLLPFTEDGIHINSDLVNGLNNKDALTKLYDYIAQEKLGSVSYTYKLRDWVFSRQRYWGEPFPLYFDTKGKVHLLKSSELPLLLPKLKNIKPSGTGKSPLANLKSWVSFTRDGQKYSYDTNTMPQLAASSWYYIAHLLKKKNGGYYPLSSKKAKDILSKWLPVDVYIGGKEHAVGHLLYARFWHRFLYDQNLVSSPEPFTKLINQGMILSGSEKMSKSKGNIISPNEIYELYGADSLRLFEMFLGPITQDKPWSTEGLKASRKFIDRVINITSMLSKDNNPNLDVILNQSIKKVDADYNSLSFNTAISQIMILVNKIYQEQTIGYDQFLVLLKLLNPIIPHITEELNLKVLKREEMLINTTFPSFDETVINNQQVELIFQVCGKLRGKAVVSKGLTETEALKLAQENENVLFFMKDKEIKKIIYIPDRIINIVVG